MSCDQKSTGIRERPCLGDRPPAAGGCGSMTPIFIGDDITDEDAFDAVRDPDVQGVPIVVRHSDDGDRATAALFALDSPAQVGEFTSDWHVSLQHGPTGPPIPTVRTVCDQQAWLLERRTAGNQCNHRGRDLFDPGRGDQTRRTIRAAGLYIGWAFRGHHGDVSRRPHDMSKPTAPPTPTRRPPLASGSASMSVSPMRSPPRSRGGCWLPCLSQPCWMWSSPAKVGPKAPSCSASRR